MVSISLACAGAVVLPSGRALAQDQAAVDKLVQMNKKALDDYDTLDWDAAKQMLLDALVAGKKAGLDNHPVMARTYIHLGAVYITGFKDRQQGCRASPRALEIDPTIQLSKGIETGGGHGGVRRGAAQSAAAAVQRGGDDDNAPPPPKQQAPRAGHGGGRGARPSTPAARQLRPSGDDGSRDLPAHVGALDCPEPDEAIIDKPLTSAARWPPTCRSPAST